MKKDLYLLVIILIISFIIALYFTFVIGRRLEKVIINYSTTETERIANVILNDVIDFSNDAFPDDFFEVSRDSFGNIELINFNSKVTNSLLNDINKNALQKLSALEKGDTSFLELSDSLKGSRLTYLDNGVVCDIPIGVLYHNSLIVNLSASIPIRFSFIGTVSSKLVTDVKEYGFNSALIEVAVEITIKEKITMPHSTESIPIKSKINIATQIIQGKVPTYYDRTFESSSQTFSYQN